MPNTRIQTKEEKSLAIRRLLAKAFNIPVQGIVFSERFGNKPYINALGLKMAWLSHPDLIKIEAIELTKAHEKIGDQALVTVRGKYKVGEDYQPMSDVGSASAANLSMTKGFPNEMAYTRAFSRFLRWRLMPQLLEDFEKNIKNFSAGEKKLLQDNVADFGTVSLEEMPTVDESKVEPEVMLSVEQMGEIKPILEELALVRDQEGLDGVFAKNEELRSKINKKQRQVIQRIVVKTMTKYNLEIPVASKKE